MCGICGFTGPPDPELLSRMTGSLSHRGPDQSGYYEDPCLSLGQRRLSIIDLSRAGAQPYFNEDRTVAVIYNGEIYNFAALRKELLSRGHILRSNTDGEVIVHLFEERGLGLVDSLIGMFAIAIWDTQSASLHLIRDRIGVKPLYYYINNNRLLFASEIKALMEYDATDWRVDTKAFIEYMVWQYVPGSKTCVTGIQRLDPGSILTWHNGTIAKKKYWDLNLDINYDPEAPKRIKDLLKKAVNDRMVADVPVGVLLSGGLDSSTVVAMVDRNEHPQLNTFTVGFGRPSDEFEFAREVASAYQTTHHEIIVSSDNVADELTRIAWSLDEPMADGGGIATYLAMRELSGKIKVLLVGEGSDELLAGYSWHRLGLMPYNLLPLGWRTRAYYYLTTFARRHGPLGIDLYEEFMGRYETCRNEAGGGSFSEAITAFEIKNLLPNSLLMKVDKMTMAHSIEARVPFLDHRLVEYLATLPVSQKASCRQGKKVLRQAVSDLLPQRVMSRRKQGFSLPVSSWLRGPWRDLVIETLGREGSYAAQVLDSVDIATLLEPKKGLADIETSSFVWRLFLFELWHDAYFKNPLTIKNKSMSPVLLGDSVGDRQYAIR